MSLSIGAAPSHSVWSRAAEQRQHGAITGTGACSKAALISGAGDNIKGFQRQGHSDPQPPIHGVGK